MGGPWTVFEALESFKWDADDNITSAVDAVVDFLGILSLLLLRSSVFLKAPCIATASVLSWCALPIQENWPCPRKEY